jgi:hypothetical protein
VRNDRSFQTKDRFFDIALRKSIDEQLRVELWTYCSKSPDSSGDLTVKIFRFRSRHTRVAVSPKTLRMNDEIGPVR